MRFPQVFDEGSQRPALAWGPAELTGLKPDPLQDLLLDAFRNRAIAASREASDVAVGVPEVDGQLLQRLRVVALDRMADEAIELITGGRNEAVGTGSRSGLAEALTRSIPGRQSLQQRVRRTRNGEVPLLEGVVPALITAAG